MRRAWVAILVGLILLGSLAATAIAQGKPLGPGGLAGSREALMDSLKAPTAVHYTVLVYDDLTVEDRTAFLEQYLTENGWPAPDTLLLMIFPRHNHDIRFAMGTNLTKNGMTAEEMLAIIRGPYFGVVRKGDPARALVEMIEAVNRRMAPAGSTLSRPEDKPAQKPEPKSEKPIAPARPLPPTWPPVRVSTGLLAQDPFAFLTVKVGGNTGSSISFDREPTVGELVVQTTMDLGAARRFAGHDLVLPPHLEGKEIYLVKETDKSGATVMLSVNVPEAEFYARYRPAGDHGVKLSLSADFTVIIEPQVVAGRSARLFRLDMEPYGKHYAQLWVADGNWVYEFHETAARGDNLLSLAAQMK